MIDWLRKDMQNPSVEIDGTHLPIAIRRHARAKRLTMRLAPDGSEVRITLPRWGRTLDAITFANARKPWIARQICKVPAKLEIAPGADVPYRGGTLLLNWQAGGSRKVLHKDGTLHVGGPQDRLAGRVQRWLEAEALRLTGEDLAHYCSRADLPVSQLRLSRAKRRWGSCSGESRNGRCIRINWRLVMAPDHVRQSVVAHEVAHLVHFDHSPAFHGLLGEIFDGDISEADAWLKTEGRSLYAVFS
ncbi:M48 family metallopeptidase [Aurantiacibacter sp. MUD61]|uniref:M48 family metallopeptidase n=1 Tax=Aurantiacibacter sp. MUD61 TaxID=3009083 RepID=UPI0022F0E792|nr:YgjP-like metallopeptidase domain-containing protein [Aurantiacibacter sp. MUD61]